MSLAAVRSAGWGRWSWHPNASHYRLGVLVLVCLHLAWRLLLTVPSSGWEKPHLILGLEGQTLTPPRGFNWAPAISENPAWGTCNPGEVEDAGISTDPHFWKNSISFPASSLNSVQNLSRSQGPLSCLYTISRGHTHITK